MAELTASSFMPLKGEKRWAYLTREKTIRLASTNEDGSIYLSPLWYVVNDKRIFVPLDAGGRHGGNGTSGRPLSALVDSGDEYATVHGVRIHGNLKLVSDSKIVTLVNELMFDKYFYIDHPYAERYFEFGEFVGRQVYELIPEKMIGWDMRETSLPTIPEKRNFPAHIQDRLLP